MEVNMNEQINKLHKEGKSLREISTITGIPKSTVSDILNKVSEKVSETNVSEDTVRTVESRCPLGRDPKVCELKKEVNRLGVHKLRACDYTKEELLKFKDAPYWDCS